MPAFPSPVYLVTTQLNGVNRRKLAATAGSSSVLTKGLATGLLNSPRTYYLLPEQTATVNEAVGAVGTAKQQGWGLVPQEQGLVPLVTDGFTLASGGSFQVVMTASRDNPLLSGNLSATYTMILFRANSTASGGFTEIVRTTAAGPHTITTTASSFSVSLSIPSNTVFQPGEILWLEVWARVTSAATTNCTPSFTTNVTSGSRITSTANYTRNFTKALADSAPLSDSLARLSTYTRALADAEPLSEALARQYFGPRALLDARTPLADSLSRLFVANRSLADSRPISDAITRAFTSSRSLADSETLSESLARALIYGRPLLDALATGGGGTVINNYYRPLFVFDD